MSLRSFPGKFVSLAKINVFIEKEAKGSGLDDNEIYAVQLAVDEACANIIEHAYGGEGKGKISIECLVQDDGFEIIIKDTGKRFDPKEVAKPRMGVPLTDLGSRGAGVYLINKIMDQVKYRFNDEGTTLWMVKRSAG